MFDKHKQFINFLRDCLLALATILNDDKLQTKAEFEKAFNQAKLVINNLYSQVYASIFPISFLNFFLGIIELIKAQSAIFFEIEERKKNK